MKSKVLRILIDLILIALGIVFLVFGIKDAIKEFSKPQIEDNIRFTKSYTNVPTDNIFKYIESLDLVKDENAVVFIANPKDAWSQVLSYQLNDILKTKYKTIYYLEQEITEDIPTIVVIKDLQKKTYEKKDIIDEDYKDAPIDYWTKERIEKLSQIFE